MRGRRLRFSRFPNSRRSCSRRSSRWSKATRNRPGSARDQPCGGHPRRAARGVRASEGNRRRHPGLIAQQELDDAQAKDLSSEAQVDAAKAAMAAAKQHSGAAEADNQRVQALHNYTNVPAPISRRRHLALCRYGCAHPGRHQFQQPGSAHRPALAKLAAATAHSGTRI